MKNTTIILLLATGSCLGQGITNASFENAHPDAQGNPDIDPDTLAGRNVVPDGWSLFSTNDQYADFTSPDWINTTTGLYRPFATDGNYALILDTYNITGDSPRSHESGVSNQITGLSQGQEYRLSFDAAQLVLIGAFYIGGSAFIDLYFGEESLIFAHSFEITSTVTGSGVFTENPIFTGTSETYSFDFIAESDNINFGVRSRTETDNVLIGIGLDHFRVNPIPEPSAALLGSIVCLLGASHRRRSCKAQ